MKKLLLLSACVIGLAACGNSNDGATTSQSATTPDAETTIEKPDLNLDLDTLARKYVLLALAFGQYDENYVDAYTGPEAWREEALATEKTKEDLFAEAVLLASELSLVTPDSGDEKRLDQLRAVVQAMIARMRMARGERLDFDEETAVIYDAIAPTYNLRDFDTALAALEDVLPGEGSLAARDQAFREQLVVPTEQIQPVMEAAIAACGERTLARYDLPTNESFDLEFVNDKPWSAYNYYQGDFKSLIQVNLDAPFTINRALDLGCHEGYPGHHVWNIYMEREFLNKNNWIEYYVFPLFSPSAFFAEGSANYGVDIAFPDDEKIIFERDTLYPIAGIDQSIAETYVKIAKAKRKLSHINNHVARDYLDGRLTREDAEALLMKYRLYTQERASQSVDFMDTYRGYVINYTLGYDMVKIYIEANASSDEDRWRVFEEMLEVPLRASDLKVE